MSIDIEKVRARAEAASDGKWTVGLATFTGYYVRTSYSDPTDPTFIEDDAEFIAHAREDVPALLDEVERLRPRAVASLTQMSVHAHETGMMRDRIEQLSRLVKGAEAERDRLRAAVDAVWEALANDRPDGRGAVVRLPLLRGEIRSAIEEHLGEEG